MRCVFCEFTDRPSSEARYVVDGLSVCHDHIDDADGPGVPFAAKIGRDNQDRP